MTLVPTGAKAKELGAYYTDLRVATFLASWAIRSPDAKVIDPSFGGGVFLEAASQRLRRLGGLPAGNVYGVELDQQVHEVVTSELGDRFGVSRSNLLHSDFFAVDPESLPSFDAVIGNPPFIRYQAFNGSSRQRALARAAQHGVRLTKLSSSWAPFLVHAVSLLRRGGALGMVIPMELAHAVYARPVLDFLRREFGSIRLIGFQTPLFADLSQDTMLLLADDRGGEFRSLRWSELPSVEDIPFAENELPTGTRLDLPALVEGRERLIKALIPPRARGLYDDLVGSPAVARLGELAKVSIGYVSGANAFFHLSAADASTRGLSKDVLRRAVFRGKAFTGLDLTEADWSRAASAGHAGYLLSIPPTADLPWQVAEYLRHGEELGVNAAYKCRVRNPWYSVPGAQAPDGFITYMSGARPAMSLNSGAAVAPNTLLTVSLRPSGHHHLPHALAAGWQTSLANLSMELEGHAMGGGMLKLEPREAQKVAIPLLPDAADGPTYEIDALLRAGRTLEARKLADERLLRAELGLSQRDIASLQEAAESLRDRRHRRWGEA